ncbi:hypothetical protein [Bradyrhizobium liaoningense]|uniref:hypothetical protein n=1 Tax=Bradyrhizobium liaoningense TaxID=43992 RepID=UPI001BA5F9F2|nr:hypothetical protein [Bradyrhizobium liaoningense]MBR0715675.1 hypothetical protein [Bradyrhizobium liaoningense]
MLAVTSLEADTRRSRALPTADVASLTREAPANRHAAIRKKGRLEHASASDCAVKHENIFVAKKRDSESAKRFYDTVKLDVTRIIASILRNARVQKNTCCIEFSCSRCSRRCRCCAMLLQSETRASVCTQIKRARRRRFAASTLP